MLYNIVGFYNMAQQAVERTSQSDNKITYAIIKDHLGDCMQQLTRMKFKVGYIACVVMCKQKKYGGVVISRNEKYLNLTCGFTFCCQYLLF